MMLVMVVEDQWHTHARACMPRNPAPYTLPPPDMRASIIIKKLRINLSTAHSSRIRPWPLQHVCGNSAS